MTIIQIMVFCAIFNFGVLSFDKRKHTAEIFKKHPIVLTVMCFTPVITLALLFGFIIGIYIRMTGHIPNWFINKFFDKD